MSEKDQSPRFASPSMPPAEEVAPTARRIMRLADKVALATISPIQGGPFLSLTGVATLMDVTPVLLMSELSRHSQNLREDDRASLLFDGTGDHANPLTEDRVSVNGRIVRSNNPDARARFMARHPKAFYADFADFSFYEMEIEDAHFVGGFGTALTIPAKVLALDRLSLGDLSGMEHELIAYMNDHHGEAVGMMAVRLCKAKEGLWRLTGIDPEGCDFMARKRRCRLVFPQPVTSPLDVRAMLVSLARDTRRNK